MANVRISIFIIRVLYFECDIKKRPYTFIILLVVLQVWTNPIALMLKHPGKTVFISRSDEDLYRVINRCNLSMWVLAVKKLKK